MFRSGWRGTSPSFSTACAGISKRNAIGLARQVFLDMLRSGEMRFLVVTEALHPFRPPKEIQAPAGKQANREDGSPYVRNLFEKTMESDLNGLENRVASWIDGQERLFFWYRNRARKDYFVPGWRRGRIFPDFIFTLRPAGGDERMDFDEVFVVETKGLHLSDREDDTGYQRSVFELCSRQARKKNRAEFAPAMRGGAADAPRDRGGERMGRTASFAVSPRFERRGVALLRWPREPASRIIAEADPAPPVLPPHSGGCIHDS